MKDALEGIEMARQTMHRAAGAAIQRRSCGTGKEEESQ